MAEIEGRQGIDNEVVWVSNHSIVQGRHSFLRCRCSESSFSDVNANCTDHEHRPKTAKLSDASFVLSLSKLTQKPAMQVHRELECS